MNFLFRPFLKLLPSCRNGQFVQVVQTFATNSNTAQVEHSQSTDDVIIGAVRVLSLLLSLPGIQLTDLAVIVKPIKPENLTRSLKLFQKTGETLLTEGSSCIDLFRQASTHRHDPVRLAEAFQEVSKFHGTKEATSLLQTDVNGLIRLAERSQVKRRLERYFHLEDLHPSSLLVQQLMKSPSKIIGRIQKFDQVLPAWCLKKLIEGRGVSWFVHGAHHLKLILNIIEEALSSVMSPKSAKEGSLVCITRCTKIVDQTPNHLKHRIRSLKNSVQSEDFGDLVLNCPRLLSPQDSIDLSARHQELTIWTDTVFSDSDLFTVDSKILVLQDKYYDRVIQRLKYIALMGNNVLNDVNQCWHLRSAEFLKLYPEFSKWNAVFVDQQPDEEYISQLQLQLEQRFEEIECLRFLQKFPVFEEAFNRMSAPVPSSTYGFLLSYFGRSLLAEVNGFKQAQYLLMMSEETVRQAETKLQSELPFKVTTMKRLILSYPKFFVSRKSNQKLDKKLLTDPISV